MNGTQPAEPRDGMYEQGLAGSHAACSIAPTHCRTVGALSEGRRYGYNGSYREIESDVE